MGKAGNHALMEGVSGKVGRKAVFRESFGETIVSARPKKRRTSTPKQLEHREKFLDAAHYGKEQLKKDDVRALYATGINSKKRSAYLVATSDFMNAPKVSAIDISGYTGVVGNEIVVKASDDFKVVKVIVAIIDGTGKEIERGTATITTAQRGGWSYIATAANGALAGTKVIATAFDLADNTASLTVPVIVS